MKIRDVVCFDDVLLVPQYSEIESRKDVSVSTVLKSQDGLHNICLNTPIISASMSTVTEDRMAIAMTRSGGVGAVHRYNTVEEQVKMAKSVLNEQCEAFFSLGANGDFYDRASALFDVGVRWFNIDIAHGDTLMMQQAIKKVRSLGAVYIVAGNVATANAAARLAAAGADAIKVSVGSGALCTTRLVTGCGVPTLQAIMDVSEYLKRLEYNVSVIGDGGFKTSGDIVKGLAAGADAVMLGSLLAGTNETPGEVIVSGHANSVLMKSYAGMASVKEQSKWRPQATKVVGEGEDTLVACKGPVAHVVQQLVGGIRSGMSYCGSRTIEELQENAEFVKISSGGHTESKPHLKL